MLKHNKTIAGFMLAFATTLGVLIPSVSHAQIIRELAESMARIAKEAPAIEKSVLKADHALVRLPLGVLPAASFSLKQSFGCHREPSGGLGPVDIGVSGQASLTWLECKTIGLSSTFDTNSLSPLGPLQGDGKKDPAEFYAAIHSPQEAPITTSATRPVNFYEVVHPPSMSTDEPASVNSVVGASTLIFHNSQQRDAIPYKDRTKNIISRLDADTLPGIGTKTVSFNSEKDALGYAKTASSNYAGRRRFGTALEDTQTWFQMGKANTAEGILLLIHMTQRFDTKPLSAILFELSPEHEHRCERLPVNGLFYVLTANFSVTTGEEVVFISRLPEAELLDAQTHKCGTIIEAW